jgi:hypothetical protein
VPSDRTTVTEVGTALGMLGLADVDEALRSRAPVMRSLSPETWDRLASLRAGGAYDTEFHAAWENGRAFLAAAEGLRGRLPLVVEWKGTGRAPGDEVAPVDLRVDHVYLVSCKYLSDILFNVSPSHVFDYLLLTGQSRSARGTRDLLPGGGDWYAQVAPAEYQALYEVVRLAIHHGESAGAGDSPGTAARPRAARPAAVPGRAATLVSLPGLEDADGTGAAGEPDGHRDRPGGVVSTSGSRLAAPPAALHGLPLRATDLTAEQRDALGRWLRPGWPPGAKAVYAQLSAAVARASVRRWEAAMDVGGGTGETILWRLLRMGSAPYFVLGSSAARSLRLRIATSWDWRQQFQLLSISMGPQPAGQPRVGWEALVRDRVTSELSEITGHIEVRWSHGRFGGLHEAKGYLDTPHHLVPGYFALR